MLRFFLICFFCTCGLESSLEVSDKLLYFNCKYNFTFSCSYRVRGFFRLKVSLTFGCCPQWIIFFKNFFYQNNCKEAINIGEGQIRGALFNFFAVEKCPFFCVFQILPTVSNIIPESTYYLELKIWRDFSFFEFSDERTIFIVS